MIAVRARPGLGDAVRLDRKRRRINRPRAAQRAQHDGAVELAPPRVGHVAEPERLAGILRQSAELQPHQRHQLGVLADFFVDDLQQPAPRQLADIIAQVPIRHLQYFRITGIMASEPTTQQATRNWSPAAKSPAVETSRPMMKGAAEPIVLAMPA